MRLSSFLPVTIVMAAAALAVAHPVDTYLLASRDHTDRSLSARANDARGLLAREALAALLLARADSLDQPQREQYATHAEYEAAWLAWNRRMRQIDHATQKLVQGKNLEQPEREHYATQAEYEKAWRAWSRQSRAVGNAQKALLDKDEAQFQKAQQKAAPPKKGGGAVAKVLGKLTGKGRAK